MPYQIGWNDFEKAKNLLVEAFYDDPLYEYLLGPRHLEDSISGAMQSFMLQIGIRQGLVYAPSQDIEGVSIWLPPKQTRITTWISIKSGVLGFRKVYELKEFILFGKRMIEFQKFLDQLHNKHVPFPHYWLLEIGIGSKYRGEGYASKLINPVLEECDKGGVVAYLETETYGNIDIYRHYDFEVVEQTNLPNSNTPYWIMLREPRKRNVN